VPLARYIEDRGLTELKPQGLRLVGRCMLHEEKTPSFTVFENQSFYCFGCGAWGDVVSLHALVDGHDQQWTAMVDLSSRYGVELPERPPEWFEWQNEKGRRRRMLVEVIAESYRRRLLRCFKEDLKNIADPEERAEEARALWDGLGPLCWLCAHWRVYG
jgi:DNA primase